MVTCSDICAFNRCFSLKEIMIPSIITSIGDTAFSYSEVFHLYYPETNDEISRSVFGDGSSQVFRPIKGL